MKLFYLFIPFIFQFLIGCSTTYKITDYPSKEKFYKDFNDFAKNKNLKIISEDSAFSSFENTRINNDSLYTVTKIQEENKTIPLNEIEKVEYYGNYWLHSAHISLKNGEEINGDNIKIKPDSSIQYLQRDITYEKFPLNRIKEVKYKKNWPGLPIGFATGTVSGFALGYFINVLLQSQNSRGDEAYYIGISTISISALIGSIIGWLNGFNYSYLFNP